ncbi:hypothetical protein EGX89_07360 [Citrobacter freundii]|nr:hypothetical protein EGY10_05895 [Citrobacter freundii]AYY48410.1 hypothetical protein EGX89_07360 [Citrobacter freundii]
MPRLHEALAKIICKSLIHLQRISRRRKAASSSIPGSIENYVTGVNERSQRICDVKDAGD